MSFLRILFAIIVVLTTAASAQHDLLDYLKRGIKAEKGPSQCKLNIMDIYI